MDILPLLDELQTIARNGLNHTTNPFDRERYERLLALASKHYAGVLDVAPVEVQERLRSELGYITPKVGAEAAIFDAEGRILLVRRNDDGRWCLPCGWVEPNEAPAEAAVRETREETGLEVRPLQLVDVFTRRANMGFGPHSAIAVLYLCELLGGRLQTSHEIAEARYRRIEDVTDWHELHQEYAMAGRSAWQTRKAVTNDK